jgi:hypothetical protein
MMESMTPEIRQAATVQKTSDTEKEQVGIELDSLNVTSNIKKEKMGTEVLP